MYLFIFLRGFFPLSHTQLLSSVMGHVDFVRVTLAK